MAKVIKIALAIFHLMLFHGDSLRKHRVSRRDKLDN